MKPPLTWARLTSLLGLGMSSCPTAATPITAATPETLAGAPRHPDRAATIREQHLPNIPLTTQDAAVREARRVLDDQRRLRAVHREPCQSAKIPR